MIAVTSDYIYDALCKGTSKQVVKREAEKHYLDYEIMKAAISDCEAQIEKVTNDTQLYYCIVYTILVRFRLAFEYALFKTFKNLLPEQVYR